MPATSGNTSDFRLTKIWDLEKHLENSRNANIEKWVEINDTVKIINGNSLMSCSAVEWNTEALLKQIEQRFTARNNSRTKMT